MSFLLLVDSVETDVYLLGKYYRKPTVFPWSLGNQLCLNEDKMTLTPKVLSLQGASNLFTGGLWHCIVLISAWNSPMLFPWY